MLLAIGSRVDGDDVWVCVRRQVEVFFFVENVDYVGDSASINQSHITMWS